MGISNWLKDAKNKAIKKSRTANNWLKDAKNKAIKKSRTANWKKWAFWISPITLLLVVSFAISKGLGGDVDKSLHLLTTVLKWVGVAILVLLVVAVLTAIGRRRTKKTPQQNAVAELNIKRFPTIPWRKVRRVFGWALLAGFVLFITILAMEDKPYQSSAKLCMSPFWVHVSETPAPPTSCIDDANITIWEKGEGSEGHFLLTAEKRHGEDTNSNKAEGSFRSYGEEFSLKWRSIHPDLTDGQLSEGTSKYTCTNFVNVMCQGMAYMETSEGLKWRLVKIIARKEV